MKKLNHREFSESLKDGVRIKDTITFFRIYWKPLVITSALGFLTAVIYIFTATKLYEGVTQIQIGKVITIYNLNPANIEEPNAIIARMNISGSYGQLQIDACGANNAFEFQEALGSRIKWSLPKGILNAVELRIRDKSPEGVSKCLDSIVEHVKAIQIKEASNYSRSAEKRLIEYQTLLDSKLKMINLAEKAGSGITSTYIVTLEQIRTYMEVMRVDQNIINFNRDNPPKLIAPIYVSNEPVVPKKKIVLLIGTFGGLLMGLLLNLYRAGLLTPKRH